MPSRAATKDHAVSIFSDALGQYGDTPQHAWLGIYVALLWHARTQWDDHPYLPHIIDADKLTRGREGRLRIWQQRALAVQSYMAEKMGCPPEEVRRYTDRLMRLHDYAGLQRQNPLGIAFIALVHHVLATYGDTALDYDVECPAQEAFPGIELPGRSRKPSVDVLLRRGGRPRAIVSVKWSLRHDRVNDLTNECPVYKQAASWGALPLQYIVVTNEYDPARLDKVLGDACIDSVVHVHKPALVDVSGLDGRLAGLLDLTGLVERTHDL